MVTKNYCCHEDCKITACFNFKDEKRPIYCASHKKEGMIITYGNYCQHEGCNLIANFNIEGEKKGIYCF